MKMEKYAESTKEFMGFTLAEKENDINPFDWHTCECEMSCDDCYQDPENCNGDCPDPECYCECWTEEVSMDVIEYDWQKDKFYTQQQLDENYINSIIEEIDRGIKWIEKTKAKIEQEKAEIEIYEKTNKRFKIKVNSLQEKYNKDYPCN